VSDTWPPAGPQKPEPLLEHIRECGRFTGRNASIWRNDFGLELLVEHGGELIESHLCRFGAAPLLVIADRVKADLIGQGWFEHYL